MKRVRPGLATDPWLRTDARRGGVSSDPAYWLIDPEGKIVSKAADPDELVELLDKRLK